jgi:hypothetical protein
MVWAFYRKKNILKEKIKEEQLRIDKIVNAIQIASAIMAYARMQLLNVINEHIKKGRKIYYYDTDSMHTDKILDDKIVDSKKLGKFKLENKIKKKTLFEKNCLTK